MYYHKTLLCYDTFMHVYIKYKKVLLDLDLFYDKFINNDI
jgi:hypothetical protein